MTDYWATERDEIASARRPDDYDPRDQYDPLDDYEPDREAFPLSPDCRTPGKCAACIGDAWDDEADDVTECACACHEQRPTAGVS